MVITHSKTIKRHNIIKLLPLRMANQFYRKASMSIQIVLIDLKIH